MFRDCKKQRRGVRMDACLAIQVLIFHIYFPITSSAMRVLLYSKWCLSMMEEP